MSKNEFAPVAKILVTIFKWERYVDASIAEKEIELAEQVCEIIKHYASENVDIYNTLDIDIY